MPDILEKVITTGNIQTILPALFTFTEGAGIVDARGIDIRGEHAKSLTGLGIHRKILSVRIVFDGLEIKGCGTTVKPDTHFLVLAILNQFFIFGRVGDDVETIRMSSLGFVLQEDDGIQFGQTGVSRNLVCDAESPLVGFLGQHVMDVDLGHAGIGEHLDGIVGRFLLDDANGHGTAQLGRLLSRLFIHIQSMAGVVGDDAVLTGIRHHREEVRVARDIGDPEGNLGQGRRHLVEDVFELIQRHVLSFDARPIALVAEGAVSQAFAGADLQVQNFRPVGGEIGIVLQLLPPAFKLASFFGLAVVNASDLEEVEVVARRPEQFHFRRIQYFRFHFLRGDVVGISLH